MDYQRDLQRAFKLADEADKITVRYFLSSKLEVKTKPDNTPVTLADTSVEETLSKIVHEEFNESYLGEESVKDESPGRRWVVDPIDGTKNYLRGIPVWATLIGLVEDGKTIAGVVTAPALGRRWWATAGGGAWTEDVDGEKRALHVSKIGKLSDAFLIANFLKGSEGGAINVDKKDMLQLVDSVWRERGFGDFWGYILVAEGAADIYVDPGPKEWDITAPGLILSEAGGLIWIKRHARELADGSSVAVATNAKLHDQVLRVLHL